MIIIVVSLSLNMRKYLCWDSLTSAHYCLRLSAFDAILCAYQTEERWFTMYNKLYDNRNMWYDALNDVHENKLPHDYFYAYLSCINEFNDEDWNLHITNWTCITIY